MTDAARDFWLRVQRRAALLQPDFNRAILRAFENLRASLSESEMAELIAAGDLAALVNDVFGQVAQDVAFTPVRNAVQSGVAGQTLRAVKDLPRAGRVNGRVVVAFDYLNPKVIDAVRGLDSKVITTLQGETREVVRAFVENGLRDGVSSRTIARQIRDVVGLSPTQEAYVRNLRDELVSGRYADASRRVLLDKRFRLDLLDGLSPAARAQRIDTIVTAYRKSFIAFNAETNARTASLDATKLGQRLAWEDAAAKGIVDRAQLEQTWRGVKDTRERPEHLALEGVTVGFDEPFPNGERVPGDSTYNCRCVAIVRLRTAQRGPADEPSPPAALPSQPVTSVSFEDTLRTVENDIRRLAKERAIAWDAAGHELLRKQGTAARVTFTAEELRQIRGASVMTHNHPNGSPFSLDDWRFADGNRIRELRAVGVEPATDRPITYRMVRTDVPGAGDIFQRALATIYNKASLEAEFYTRVAGSAQTMSAAERSRVYFDVVHERLEAFAARVPMFTYSRSYE